MHFQGSNEENILFPLICTPFYHSMKSGTRTPPFYLHEVVWRIQFHQCSIWDNTYRLSKRIFRTFTSWLILYLVVINALIKHRDLRSMVPVVSMLPPMDVSLVLTTIDFEITWVGKLKKTLLVYKLRLISTFITWNQLPYLWLVLVALPCRT